MIPVAAVVSAIGGVRATAFLGLALALGVTAGVQTLRLDSSKSSLAKEQASHAAYRTEMTALTAKAATLAAQARVEFQEAQARAEANYQAGRDSAEQHQATVVADLRSGNLRLRNEWQGCMSSASASEAPSTASSGPNEQAPVSAEAFGRVLRVGLDADNQVTWLQAELLATRQLAQQCGKTE